MYELYMKKILFPVTPSKISMKINGKNKTVNLINEGEINIIKTSGLTEFSFELLLPMLTKYPFASYENGVFQDANYYLKKLEKMKTQKKSFPFLLIRYSPRKEYLSETRLPVTLEDYKVVEDYNDGLDVRVSVSLKQWKAYGTETLVIKKNKKGKKVTTKKKKARVAFQKGKTYTVKPKDSLAKIAKTMMDSPSMRTELYRMNADTIELAARKNGRKSSSHGFFLEPGIVLKLPEME